jgi:hypothetical protein
MRDRRTWMTTNATGMPNCTHFGSMRIAPVFDENRDRCTRRAQVIRALHVMPVTILTTDDQMRRRTTAWIAELIARSFLGVSKTQNSPRPHIALQRDSLLSVRVLARGQVEGEPSRTVTLDGALPNTAIQKKRRAPTHQATSRAAFAPKALRRASPKLARITSERAQAGSLQPSCERRKER